MNQIISQEQQNKLKNSPWARKYRLQSAENTTTSPSTPLPGQLEIQQNGEIGEVTRTGKSNAAIDTSKPPKGDLSGGAEGDVNNSVSVATSNDVKGQSNGEIRIERYAPTKEELEEGVYTSGNMEILVCQKKAMNRLITVRKDRDLRKGISQKEIIRDALDDYLRREYKKL